MILAVSSAAWGGLAVLYFLLMVTLGLIGLRKGHWVMFILGFLVPLFWVFGALLGPARPDEGRP